VKEIIKLRSNVVIKKFSDLDMIVDYFSYAIIYGQDVTAEACRPEKVYTYDWSKLVKDIPEKTVTNHLAIQKDIEVSKPRVAEEYVEIADQKAKQNGWDSLTQKEYFTNIDRYEDLTFTENGNNRVPRIPIKEKSKKISKKK
jgi:hypothetical protein